MRKIRSFFNKNKEFFLMVAMIIAFGFILLKLLNYVVRKQNEQNSQELVSDNTITYDRDYEILSGSRKDITAYEKEKNLIEEFFNYCNQKDFSKAYDLISQECKDLFYQDLDVFVNEYGNKYFDTKKNYNIQAWNANMYRIKLMGNLLETGSTGDTNYLEDYYCIVEGKLNLNSFIDTYNMINREEKANVVVQFKRIDIYVDYLDLTINFENGRETSIMLNSLEDADNVYLMDSYDSKFVALLHEIPQDEFIIGPGESKDVTIRFDIPSEKIEDIQSFNMDNVIADYEQYQELGDSRLIQFYIKM